MQRFLPYSQTMKPSLFSIYKLNSILTKNRKLSVSMESNRQPSNGLKFNLKKCRLVLSVKESWGISNLAISPNLHGPTSGSWRVCKSENPVPIRVLKKTLSLDIKDLATCLYLKLFQNFKNERPRQFNSLQLMLIHAQVNIYQNCWNKFPLNRQPSKALKI